MIIFFKYTLSVKILGVLIFLNLHSGLTEVKAKDHNVLLIAIDDLNDWVGCMNTNAAARTPNIDRLSKRGVLFTNAHCQAPICNPSRTSLMLGLRPSSTGIYVNNPWFRSLETTRSRMTMTQYFRKFGYRTMSAGKIFHGSKVDKLSFENYGPRPGQISEKDKRIQKDSPSKTRLWDFGPQNYDEKDHTDYQVSSWCLEQLKDEDEKPFFMAVGFYRPHVPMFAPESYFKSRPLDKVVLPSVKADDRKDLPLAALDLIHNTLPPSHDWFVKSGKWKEAVQAYHACVTYTDRQVGRILDALDSSIYSKNTIVILFSDHGFHLGEKQMWAKRSLWERSTRVPLIVSLPDGLQGKRCSKPVELLSIYPTLVEACGLPAIDDLDGVSIKPLLDDPSREWRFPALTTFKKGNHSVRSERYRYIQYFDGSEEFYDHMNDPEEWVNLSSDDRYESLIKKHANMLKETLRKNENKTSKKS